MKRLLVLAYYFPPMGLSGVQRIAKFVKYLPENGWAPTVLTTEPGGYFAFDESLLDDVNHPAISIERVASIDPTRLFGKKRTVSLPAEPSRSVLSKVSQFVFVPDNKIGWMRPAIKKAHHLHRKQPFDAILATAPPYTTALAAAQLGRAWNVPVTLDFRDDWLGNPRHVYPTALHRLAHRRLERSSLLTASTIVTINEPIAEALRRRLGGYGAGTRRVCVIPQGFDAEDFAGLNPDRQDGRMQLLYSGVFYDVQTPDHFLKAIASFLQTHPESRKNIEARFVGLLPAASHQLIESLCLSDVVTFAGYLNHRDAVQELVNADVLWMTVGSGKGQETISTGKLFEYFGARKPIVGLVPEGAARQALEDYGAAYIAEPDDVPAIAALLVEAFDAWKEGKLPKPAAESVEKYDRRYLTEQLCPLLQ